LAAHKIQLCKHDQCSTKQYHRGRILNDNQHLTSPFSGLAMQKLSFQQGNRFTVQQSQCRIISGKEYPCDKNKNQLTALRKNNLGFIFQSFNLIDELTVYENVELPLVYMGIKTAQRKEKVNKVLEKVNLLHRANHYPQQLSGGQQQRVAIARAVVTDCKLLLADEPTGNLDSVNGVEVMELLSELNRQGTTIIIVTHSQRDATYAHRIIRLLDGQIVSENINRPLEKSTSSKNEAV
jgi:putative ABC transport system ATP-binding protein